MAIKQGTDELVLIRKAGDKKDANKVMWVTELERETEKDRDTEATVDGPVNSGGTLESTVTINCYMNQDDTLCDEIEDATEEDTPYELWVINKKVKNSEGKYKAEYRQGYWNSMTLMISQNSKQNLVYISKRNVDGLLYQNKSRKTKQLMASTILLPQILRTMVLLQKISHNLTNLAQ